MQNTLDITGAGYECDFTGLYPGYSILIQRKDTTQICNDGVTDGGTRVRTSPDKPNTETDPPFCLYFSIQYFFWFSASCCFLRFSEVFGLLFFGDSRFKQAI